MASNTVISNAGQTDVTIVVKRGADLTVGLRGTVGEVPIDWTTVTPRIEVRSEPAGVVRLEFEIGSGLSVDPGDNTRLILTKPALEYNLPRGNYQWDLLIRFSDTVARYPVGGMWKSVDSITENV